MRWKWRLSLTTFVLALGFTLAQSNPSQDRAQDRIAGLTADDLARGKKIYNGQCALCHGIGGVGGRGPALNLTKLDRAANGAALFKIIKEGIRGSEMPQFWMLTDAEIWQVAGYVRSLGGAEPVKLPGDVTRGRQVFETKGNCAACHIVRGQGGVAGPELTEIGLRRSPAYLREALLDPDAAAPEGFMVISVTAADGRRIRGVRLNEDSFTVQIRDAGNRFHSFRKSEIKELKKEFGVSTMPSYKETFTATELDDLIAYLYSLRGQK
ncbi:MAG TPA: c-type cytochrome [Blastocatellia bacterium]|nr:c-type cytochrome [Blastocatellia bacterium]